MDKKLQDSLSNFASALENLVEELRTQGDVKDENKNAYQAILGKGGMKTRMKRIEAGIKKIKDDTTKILKNQTELLKLSKAKKQEEGGGLFNKSGDKKSMDKIKDGVGTIILIAGAVLAIGMAFKIISPVDVVSVLALSFAITMLGLTLAKLNENGMPSVKDSLMIGLALLSFTTGVVASSYLLQYIPEVSGAQLLTFGAILGMFALMSFGMENLMDGMKGMKPQHVVYLPIILAGISLAILASSFILNEVQEIKYSKLLNILAMGTVLGLLAIVMSIPMYIIGKMGGSIVKGALLSVLIFPAMSLAVMLSSWLISKGDYSQPIPLDWALNFGLTMLILSIPVAILGMIGPMAFVGALALVAISAAIVASAKILSYLDPGSLNAISDGIAYFLDVVGASIVKFATDVLPPLTMFLQKILNELFPYFREIMNFGRSLIEQIDDIILSIARVLESVGGIIGKIGDAFGIIGDKIIGILGAIKNIIATVADSIVNVMYGIADSLVKISQLDAGNMALIGLSLISIGTGLGAIAIGGAAMAAVDFFGGGIGSMLKDISQYHKQVYLTGKGIDKLAQGIKVLNNVDIDSEQINTVLTILDKINNTGASANIETVNRQVLDGTKLVEQIKDLSVPQNEELVSEMRTMNRQLSQIVAHSSNISSQLHKLRIDDSEPELKFN